MANLSSDSFLIYIKTRSNLLNNIFFEVCGGFSFSWSAIETSNGKQKHSAVGAPKPGNVSISKAANPSTDFIIGKWLSQFCLLDQVGELSVPVSGDSLVLVPRTSCKIKNLTDSQILFYNIQPVSFSGWAADFMSTSSMSRLSIDLSYSSSNILPTP